MFTILQAGQHSTKHWVMSAPKKTVSKSALEEEWLEVQAAQKNPARFRPLYDRYYEPIFRFVFRRTGDENTSADLCSQVFLKALQRLNSYEYRGVPFSAWLYRIASNEVAQYFRQAQQDRIVSVEEASIGEMAEELSEGDGEWLRFQLVRALDQLDESDLQLIEMRFFEQRPFKEIADITGITESNAKVKTYRILEKMKRQIGRQVDREV
jgi:RNA polymerase sigma-70 factor, ECF subfamily